MIDSSHKKERRDDVNKRQETLRRTINAKVLAIMEMNDFGREKMASSLGISTQTLGIRLRLEAPWTCDEISKIAEIGGVQPSQILQRTL